MIYMDKRRSKRVIVDMPAELINGDMRCAGSIENISEDGIYLVTPPLKPSNGFVEEALLELKFKLPSGEKIKLDCKVKWLYETPPHGFTNSIGLEIINPPLTYLETLNTM